MAKNVLTVMLCAVVIGVEGSTVTVVAPQSGAARSVLVGGRSSLSYGTGKLAPLSATANAGWAFAGWYLSYDEDSGQFSDAAPLANSVDGRLPRANYVVGEEDVTIYARFVTPGEDTLSYDFSLPFWEFVRDDRDRPLLSLTNALDLAVFFDSRSFPTVTVSGLPAGLTFDTSSLRLKGTPTEPGIFKVEVLAKNASGFTFEQIFSLHVENVATEHVEGGDVEVDIGEEYEAYFDDLFGVNHTNATVRSVVLMGLPSGLSVENEMWDDYIEYVIKGTPDKAGEFVVWCQVVFSDGTIESASLLFRVNDLEPFDYNPDLSGLRGFSVGDSLEQPVPVGWYDFEDKTGLLALKSLPPGLSLVQETTDDGYDYFVTGMFTKAGEFTVNATVAYEDWESGAVESVTIPCNIMVGDRPDIYVSACAWVLDGEKAPDCKVSGEGVYAIGSSAELKAMAANTYVFAGWYDYAGIPFRLSQSDYRNPSISVTVEAGMERDWYASFIPKVEDWIDLNDLDGTEYVLNVHDAKEFQETFSVASGSLPTLKFTNLPVGIACSPSVEVAGDYALSYDPLTATKRPTPGRYRVTATGTNASRNSDTATFRITVLNYTDEDIHVEDDYGVLTPNVAMAPISLSNVVDFARGDTLAVSGLPAGLKYNDKLAPFCLTGIPTKPGEYTLTFKAKIVEAAVTNETTKRVTCTYCDAMATAFITVKDFPTVVALLSDEATGAGCKVTGTGSFKAGTKVTLKAAAAKDWTFAGWSGLPGAEGLAALNPSFAYVMGTGDLTEVEANFIHKRDDVLIVTDPGIVPVAKGVAVSTNLIEALIETRSLPTVTVTGLPTGLKFDAKTFLINGTVGKTAKAGYVYVTVAAKNASGYAFTRILKFVVLENPGDEIPEEPALANDARIDFSDLDGMATGEYYPQNGLEALAFFVDPATNGAEVASVSVNGLPAGLKSAVAVEDGKATMVIYGTPTKPGRYTLKVQVSYADRKKATSEYAFIVEDGGSGWLDVESFDATRGTVTGSGVYASGATVKLAAKPAIGNVFAGWYEDEGMSFDILAETDGVDFRTAAATFLFRKAMFSAEAPVLFGSFLDKEGDAISIEGLGDAWEIDPSVDDELAFAVNSASLPRLTVSGLPKGVTLNVAAGKFVYSSAAQAQIVPGYYTVTVKAVNLSNASVSEKFSVFVANKTTGAIGGLNPAADAYPFHVGVALDPEAIMPEVDVADGWKLTATGLPAGLKLVQDKKSGTCSVTGVPTKATTNTVSFTATKGKQKEVATITMTVAALPAWANGTYDGAYYAVDDGETNAVGAVSLTVSAAGKVSGKILTGGKTYSFAAASLEAFDAEAEEFSVRVAVAWTKTDTESFLLSVGSDEDGIGYVVMEPTEDGASFVETMQNVWLRKELSVPDFATGKKQPVLNMPGGIICKFGAKGVVALSGKLGDIAVNGKSQLLLSGAGVDGKFVIYVVNKNFEGGAHCEVVEVALSDTDGDGKLDAVEEK